MLHLAATAQDSARLDKHFRFADGVYFSWSAFRQNAPDLAADAIRYRFFTNPKTRRTVVEDLRTADGRLLPLDTVRVLVREGVPYLGVVTTWTGDSVRAFVPLKVRGKICYLTWTDTEVRQAVIRAWNPKTGRPFRTGRVPVEHEVTRQKIVFFPTGEMADFTRANLRRFVADDAEVLGQLDALPPDADERDLYRLLLQYDARNPVLLPLH
ncbi:MAG: hypothetical protein D6818_06465 [Bacteroidetes bacterium]|nr:MAG: hypothetical protein D6818_06465 [Bacteroidota bacterium]